MRTARMVGRFVTPVARKNAPGLAANFVRQAFDRAVDGYGAIPGAAESAERRLRARDGHLGTAVRDVVDTHVRMAGVQGFLTNLGGLVTMSVTVPANVSGLAILQCHMVGGIAHLRGYDLHDPRVRNAVLACMLGESTVRRMVKSKRLPSTPMALATAPVYDAGLDRVLAKEVASELLQRVAGKRTMATMGRKLPVIGGGVGMVTDGLATYEVGRYAAVELKARPPRLP